MSKSLVAAFVLGLQLVLIADPATANANGAASNAACINNAGGGVGLAASNLISHGHNGFETFNSVVNVTDSKAFGCSGFNWFWADHEAVWSQSNNPALGPQWNCLTWVVGGWNWLSGSHTARASVRWTQWWQVPCGGNTAWSATSYHYGSADGDGPPDAVFVGMTSGWLITTMS